MPPKYEFSNFCLMNKKLCLSKGFKDQISEKLFPSDGPKGLEPKQTFADGNCLYRAMSKIICGNENRHVELRVRTFIELCLNRDKYLNNSYLKELTGLDDYMENLLGSSFDLSSKTKRKPKSERQREGFEAGIVDNIKPGTYSTMWHIFALSNILGFSIQTVYPDVRSSLVNRNYVNVCITPSHMQHPSVAYLMWTHTRNVDLHGWTPNHFVPLLPVPSVGAAQPSAPTLNHQLLSKAQYPKNQRKDLKVHPTYHLLHLRNRSTRDHFYTSQASPARGPSSGHASLQYLECQASSVAQLVTVTYRVPNKVSKM